MRKDDYSDKDERIMVIDHHRLPRRFSNVRGNQVIITVIDDTKYYGNRTEQSEVRC
jgi:hypothetical protein